MTVRFISVGIGALLLVPLALPAPEPGAPAPTQEDRGGEFMVEFRKAMAIRATDEMEKLVNRRESDAVVAIAEICQAIGDRSSEKLEIEIEALRKAWSGAFKTRFPENYYEYHSLMRSPVRANRQQVMATYIKKQRAFKVVYDEQKHQEMPLFALEFEQIAKALEEVGDDYFASEAWRLAAIATDEHTVGSRADLEATLRNYEKSFEARKRVDLLDARYNEAYERHATLLAQGFGGGAAAPASGAAAGAGDEIPAGGAPEAEPGTPVRVQMSFDPLEEIDSVPRPIYGADPTFPTWLWSQLKEEGTSTSFGSGDTQIDLVRTGANAIMVDQDRDGEGDVEVPLSGNIERVDVEIGTGDQRRPWSFFAAIGSNRTNYQGFVVNLAPTPGFINLYMAGAGGVSGELNGVALRVFDDNLDGIYGSRPVNWALIGLREGAVQTDPDSVRIGSSKRAVPWSEYNQVGDTWYRFEVAKGGMELVATPADVKTGVLRLDFKGGRPDFVIVQGVADQWQNCYFDLVSGGSKGLEVPLGRYQFVSGRLSKGKGDQIVKALMVAGESPPEVVVGESKPATLALGAPFGFDFDVVPGDKVVKVAGQSVAVTGRGGEIYERMWNVMLQPEAAVRAKGSKRGGKAKRMGLVFDAQQAEMAEGWQASWRPLDIELDSSKLKDDDVPQVQLTVKKNKLFGSKLESEWRE